MKQDELCFMRSITDANFFGQNGTPTTSMNSAKYRKPKFTYGGKSVLSSNKRHAVPPTTLEKVVFSISSKEEIIRRAVTEVNTSTNYNKHLPQTGSVMDATLGPCAADLRCLSCGHDSSSCIGHDAFFRIPRTMICPPMIKMLLRLLRTLCVFCWSLRVDRDSDLIKSISEDIDSKNSTLNARLDAMTKKLKTRKKCGKCHAPCPRFRSHNLNILWTWSVQAQKSLAVLADARKKEIRSWEENNISGSKIQNNGPRPTEFKMPQNLKVPALSAFDDKDAIHPIIHIIDNDYLKEMLFKVPKEDYKTLNINVDISHPSNTIIDVLPITPPISRPSVQYSRSAEHKSENDITIRYTDLIKSSQRLSKAIKNTQDSQKKSESKCESEVSLKPVGIRQATRKAREKRLKHTPEHMEREAYEETCAYLSSLIHAKTIKHHKGKPNKFMPRPINPGDVVKPYEVTATSGAAKRVAAANPNQASLLGEIGGKCGTIRGDGVGKRADHGGRAVISSNVHDGCDTIRIPGTFSQVLTNHTRVQEYNIENMKKRVIKGSKFVSGAKSVKDLEGTDIDLRKMNLVQRRALAARLVPGVAIEHPLRPGSRVIINRQPTLHAAGAMAHQVQHDVDRIDDISDRIPQTIRINVGFAGGCYNADFDGDTMALHSPQDLECEAEMNVLMAPETYLHSSKNHNLQLGLIQDVVVGGMRMTLPESGTLSRYEFMQSVAQLENMYPTDCYWFNDHDGLVPPPDAPDGNYTGRALFSVLLPGTLCYSRTVNIPLVGDSEVKIVHGKMISGVLCKQVLGMSRDGIIHVISRGFGEKRALQFIDDAQRVIGFYVSQHAISISIRDMMIPKKTELVVRDRINEGIRETDKLAEKGLAAGVSESEIEGMVTSRMQEIVNQVGAISVAAIPKNGHNGFGEVPASGAKGSIVNISQVIGCVSQQNICGKRIGASDENPFYERTLPCFDRKHQFRGVEERGFNKNGFLVGQTPTQVFYHKMSSWDALIATCVRTALVGYAQRKLIKAFESSILLYDGTIRDAHNNVISFSTGTDGMDGSKLDKTIVPSKEQARKAGPMASLLWTKVKESADKSFDDKFPDKFFSPFDVTTRLIQFEATENPMRKDNSKECSRSDLLSCATRELSVLHANIKKSKTGMYANILLLHLQVEASPEKIVKVLHLKSLITKFFEKLNHLYFGSVAEPGTSVGGLVSGSIGEPLTQQTLNVFHYTGMVNFALNVGIPRLTEIIDATVSISTPSVTVKLLPGTTKAQAENLALMIPERNLNDAIEEATIFFQPNMFDASCIRGEDGDEIKLSKKCYEEQAHVSRMTGFSRPLLEWMYPKVSPFVLVMRFNRAIMNALGKSVRDIENIVVQTLGVNPTSSLPGYVIEVSNEAMSTMFIRIRITNMDRVVDKYMSDLREIHSTWRSSKFVGAETELHRHCVHALRKKLMYGVKLGGIPGITGAQVVDDGELTIRTVGTNLLKIWKLEHVDWVKTYSNDIHEMLKCLGVEAAQMTIFSEVKSIMCMNTTLVADRHMQLFSDGMTRSGYISSLSRHGLNKLGTTSALVKSSFEESNNVLVNAAMHGEVSEIKDIADSIMTGKMIPSGTGIVKLIMDPKYSKIVKVARVKNKDLLRGVEQQGGSDMRIKTLLVSKNSKPLSKKNLSIQQAAIRSVSRPLRQKSRAWVLGKTPTRSTSALSSSVPMDERIAKRDAYLMNSRIEAPDFDTALTNNSDFVRDEKEIQLLTNFSLSEPSISVQALRTKFDSKEEDKAEEKEDISNLCVKDLLNNLMPFIYAEPKGPHFPTGSEPLYSKAGELDLDVFETFIKTII